MACKVFHGLPLTALLPSAPLLLALVKHSSSRLRPQGLCTCFSVGSQGPCPSCLHVVPSQPLHLLLLWHLTREAFPFRNAAAISLHPALHTATTLDPRPQGPECHLAPILIVLMLSAPLLDYNLCKGRGCICGLLCSTPTPKIVLGV